MKFEIYEGVVLDREDPKNLGRYYVYIPELQFNDLTDSPPVQKKYSGIWCYNLVANGYIGYAEDGVSEFKDTNSVGSYVPLKPGTHVLVGFPLKNNEPLLIEGYIFNILSYRKPPNEDRDNFYLIMTTDKESWAFIDEKGEQFAVSFRNASSNVWGKEDVIHISKKSGNVVEVHDDHITIFHKSGNYVHVSDSEITVKNRSSFIKATSDRISIKSGEVYIQGDSLVAIESAAIQIRDGIPVPDNADNKSDIAKPSIDAITEINNKDKEDYVKLENGKPS